jgi:hypothetical protein
VTTGKLIGLLVTLGAIYPLALGIQVAVDTGLGDGEFSYALLHGQRRVLLETVLSDALRATLLVALLFAVLVPAGWAASRWPAMKWPFRAVLLAVIVGGVLAPLVFGVPLMLGALAALSGLGVSIWTWRAAS